MAGRNRNQEQNSGNAAQDQNYNQDIQTQNTSNAQEEDANPQRGSEWNNYQTRELGDERADRGKNRGAGAE